MSDRPPLWPEGSDAWRRLRANRMAVACGAVFAAIFLFSFAGPLIARWVAGLDAVAQDTSLGAAAPYPKGSADELLR